MDTAIRIATKETRGKLEYEVVEEEKRYSMDEIMAAFEALRRDLDGNFGEGAADRERYLIGDVAHDVRAFLEGCAAWAFGLEGGA